MRSSFPSGEERRSALGDGRELQVEALHPTQDVRGDVVVRPRARRPVLGLGDSDVRETVEQPFDADDGLGAREGRAGTGVDPEAECQMLTRVWTIHIKIGRGLDTAGVAAGGAV